MADNLDLLNRSRYYFYKKLLSYPHEAECTPFQTHYFSESLAAPGIQPGTSGKRKIYTAFHSTDDAFLLGKYRCKFQAFLISALDEGE
jgi:hypothetical protein